MQNDFLWWRDGVIYQIYPRSFADSNNDGIGDLPGIISKLDYIAALGVDAIWLSPIYPSPDRDFGYDVADYFDIDPKYGNLADFDHLLEDAHKRNIHVILDLVLNQLPISTPGSRLRRVPATTNFAIGISGAIQKKTWLPRITGNPFLAARVGNMTRQPASITFTCSSKNSLTLTGATRPFTRR
jgi:hypothetical protein